MARKRKKLKGLDYKAKTYWERLLTADGLSMEAGTSKHLSFVGSGEELASIEGERSEQCGRIKPKPQSD